LSLQQFSCGVDEDKLESSTIFEPEFKITIVPILLVLLLQCSIAMLLLPAVRKELT
jgi:hypothetical protein